MEKEVGMGWEKKIFKWNKKNDNTCVCEEWWRSKDKKLLQVSHIQFLSLSLSLYVCDEVVVEIRREKLKPIKERCSLVCDTQYLWYSS